MKRIATILLIVAMLFSACGWDPDGTVNPADTNSSSGSESSSGSGSGSGGGSSKPSNCSSCSYYSTEIPKAKSALKAEEDRLALYQSSGWSMVNILTQTKLVQAKRDYVSLLQSQQSSCGCR